MEVHASPATAMSAKARRREQTRNAMQRLRARRQQELAELRLTVERLDAARNELLQRVDLGAPFLALPLPSMALERAGRHAHRLADDNARLQRAIDGFVKWEDRVALLLEDAARSASTPLASADAEVELRAAPRLSAARAAELLVLHHRACEAVERKWLSSVSSLHQSHFFGWDLRYVYEGEYWHYKFSKRICNVSAHAVADRAWRNALHLTVYRTWFPPQRIVQHINNDTFVLARWMPSSETRGKPSSVAFHLRFRMQEPDGSITMGMQTLPVRGDEVESVDGDMAGCETVSMVFRFKPDRDTSEEEHCVVESSGRMHFGDGAHSNALEMVISLARWEELNASKPAINLSW